MKPVRLPNPMPCKYCKSVMRHVLRDVSPTQVELYCPLCGVQIGKKARTNPPVPTRT